MKPSEWVYMNEQIPHHMWEPLTRYVERHGPVGHFLTALLSNDLREAWTRADASNARVLHVFVAYLNQHAPEECWGSQTKVEAWLAVGNPGGRCACSHLVSSHTPEGCKECRCIEGFG